MIVVSFLQKISSMTHLVETHWMGKMQFNALVNGHTIIMDAPERVGGEDNGPIPKPFVLTALSGCTGMAVTDSQQKYCGVSKMLKKIMPVTWEVNYNGKKIFSNELAKFDSCITCDVFNS